MTVFQTDQTRCWDSAGNGCSCNGSGHDGEDRAGAPWPHPRFDVDKETVMDRMTGLVWSRDAGLSQFPLSWQEAVDHARELSDARWVNRTGWRLPTRRELFSLVSHARVNPAVVDPSLFEGLFNGYYWTGTPCARMSDQAWCVHVAGGRVVRGMKHASYMVWPVCQTGDAMARQLVGADRFKLSKGMVADLASGLVWMRRPQELGEGVTWSGAIDRIKRINLDNTAGHNDWRLPNIRELESLVDDTTHSPAIHPDAGIEAVADFYWSSTTSVYDPSYAWALYTSDGYLGVGTKSDPGFCVWPVRTATLI